MEAFWAMFYAEDGGVHAKFSIMKDSLLKCLPDVKVKAEPVAATPQTAETGTTAAKKARTEKADKVAATT